MTRIPATFLSGGGGGGVAATVCLGIPNDRRLAPRLSNEPDWSGFPAYLDGDGHETADYHAPHLCMPDSNVRGAAPALPLHFLL